MNDHAIHIPLKEVDGKKWLMLSTLGNKGILRAAKVVKSKQRVPDWDGHHCDIASVEGSVRYGPKGWNIL